MGCVRRAWISIGIASVLGLSACGGGSGSGTSPTPPATGTNVTTLLVDAGPAGAGAINASFATVTLCAPGTSNCTTIDHLLVDTGSTGVRVLASLLNASTVLPATQNTGGATLYECQQFADGYTWGTVRRADVQIGGEQASGIPVQLIGESGVPAVPVDCPNGSPIENSVQSLGANGVLGIGVFREDCGSACVGTAVPAAYYGCSAGACVASTVPLTAQVQHPVYHFATDNNGVLLQLPAIGAAGQLGARGSLIFGIGTQSNNALGAATVLSVDPILNGTFKTIYKGQSIILSAIDSGANAFYFADATLAACTGNVPAIFYCPATVQALSATLQSTTGVSSAVNFSVANASALVNNNSTFTAFNNLGGNIPVASGFVWGLPFFYGRSVYVAIEGQSTASGNGPYVAY
jgi:hypothetical protein